jgi:hypothetical protein
MYMNKLLCFHAKKANYGMKEYPKQKRRKLWDCLIKDYKNIKPQSYHNIYIYIYIFNYSKIKGSMVIELFTDQGLV